jgi:hypothetical protein
VFLRQVELLAVIRVLPLWGPAISPVTQLATNVEQYLGVKPDAGAAERWLNGRAGGSIAVVISKVCDDALLRSAGDVVHDVVVHLKQSGFVVVVLAQFLPNTSVLSDAAYCGVLRAGLRAVASHPG